MSHLATATRERLERLRATDTLGIYASDQGSTGTDPERSLIVSVDPTNRVERVHVSDVERVRTPAELRSALGAAYTNALDERLARTRPVDTDKPRPVVARTPVRVRPVTPEMLNRHRIRTDQGGRRPTVRRWRQEFGASDNDCVTVALPPASSSGEIDADPGWLQNATAANLGVAITQAFTAAYRRRDDA